MDKGWERGSDFPKVTQQVSSRTRTRPQDCNTPGYCAALPSLGPTAPSHCFFGETVEISHQVCHLFPAPKLMRTHFGKGNQQKIPPWRRCALNIVRILPPAHWTAVLCFCSSAIPACSGSPIHLASPVSSGFQKIVPWLLKFTNRPLFCRVTKGAKMYFRNGSASRFGLSTARVSADGNDYDC